MNNINGMFWGYFTGRHKQCVFETLCNIRILFGAKMEIVQNHVCGVLFISLF
jgi:hypothetical protein